MRGTQHTVVVESLANSGDGVGRINEKVVFIPFACPGDQLKIQITQDKKTFAKAKILEILKASEHRSVPPCEYFGDCGGCSLQHIQYEQQLYWKRQNLIQSLERIGKLEIDDIVENTQASPSLLNYRNRIQVHIDKKGFYYFKKGSSQPVYIKQCLLADAKINQELSQTPPPRRGKIEFATEKDKVATYSVNENGVSELGFRQVNSEQNQWLQGKLSEWVQKYEVSSFLDLYCGQGNWALTIADSNSTVQCVGIEQNPTNIKVARSSAPQNCRFIEGDVDTEFAKMDKKFDLAVIDPPRAGCTPDFIEMISKNPPLSLAYISCDPATLARDLKIFTEKGWQIDRIYPVDMFPQTPHLECLCFLHSANGAKTANY